MLPKLYNYSQLSTSNTMSQNFKPTFVFQRRKYNKNFISELTVQPSDVTKPSEACTSAICYEAPSLAVQEHIVSVSECAIGVKSPIKHPVGGNEVATAFSNHDVEEAGSEAALTIDVNRTLSACNANDNCSSSKSNLEASTAALKIDVVDAGECSSSGVLLIEKVPQEISGRDIAILIFRSQGLFDEVSIRQDEASPESNGVSGGNYCTKACKVCERRGSTMNMLICDNCEYAFHISCCNPRIAILPVNEWLCSSCVKRKHKILKNKSTSNVVNISTENCRNQSSTDLDLGSFEFMFRDTEPYMSNVRIGDEFQVDAAQLCGPVDEEYDFSGEPLEYDPFDDINKQHHCVEERDSIKPLKHSSIGNWLQCREVIERFGDNVDATICGKWRRAPLFEVQTDNWQCFSCVLWDPVHADCAVPQEISTEEVMKQLKYVEMLRPRLAAKRRKLDGLKSNASRRNGVGSKGKDKRGDSMKRIAKSP